MSISTQHNDHLELLALFSNDHLADSCSFANLDTVIKNEDFKDILAIDTNSDIDDWLDSVMGFCNKELTDMINSYNCNERSTNFKLPKPKTIADPMPIQQKPITSDTPRKVDSKDLKSYNVPLIYDCTFCSKKFYNKTAQRSHSMWHVKRLLSCSSCRYRTKTIGQLKRHINYYHNYVPVVPYFSGF